MQTELAVVLSILVFTTIGSVTLGFAQWFFGKDREQKKYDIASTIGFRVGSIHALVLGLVFGSVHNGWMVAQGNLAKEARTAAELYVVLSDLKAEPALSLKRRVEGYVNRMGVELEAAAGYLSNSDSAHSIANVYQLVAQLPTATDQEREAKLEVRRLIIQLSDLRAQRQSTANQNISPWFWGFYFLSFVMIVFCMGVFPWRKIYIGMIMLYCVVIGFCAISIHGLGSPYSEPMIVQEKSIIAAKEWIGQLK